MAIQHILDSDENFSFLSQKEQVRRIAYVFYVQTSNSEFSPKDLSEIFMTNNLAVPNIPRELSSLIRDRGRVIFKSKGKYVLERSFIKSMAEQFGNTYSKEISPQFHEIIDRVSQDRHKEYLREALTCFQCKLYRPAIIMTWIVVIDVLYDYVILMMY